MPLRLAGCGLRNSQRTAHAAYWASWVDCIAYFENELESIVGGFVDTVTGNENTRLGERQNSVFVLVFTDDIPTGLIEQIRSYPLCPEGSR